MIITYNESSHILNDGLNDIGETRLEPKYLTSEHMTPIVYMYKGYESVEALAQHVVDMSWINSVGKYQTCQSKENK